MWPKVIVIMLCTWGCGMFGPSLPSLPKPQAPTSVAGTTSNVVTGAVNFVQPESLWRFAWMSVLLTLFFPQIRQPLVHLWTSIFRAMAVPFMFIRDKYESKKDV